MTPVTESTQAETRLPANSAGGPEDILLAPMKVESSSARRLRERIEALNEKAREMGRVLPRAVTISTQTGGLAEALTPAVERAVALSGRHDPKILADALHPVVGAALRKSMVNRVRRSFGDFNRFMLKYASVTGLRWRREARRAGKPYSQVFFEHTHSQPVQQVFLIHRETGILLQQAQNAADVSRDWDVVSGMLTAIGDFIHDSFSTQKGEALEVIRVGDLTVLIVQGRYAALAGMLRGPMPEDLRDRFKTVLDRIHGDFTHELEVFDGETSVFDNSRAALESCLQTLVKTDRMRILPQTILAAAIVPLLVAALAYLHLREHYHWKAYVADVRAKPGIVVIQEGRKDGQYFIYGLRDPMAPEPTNLLKRHGFFLHNVDSRWIPYQAQHSTLTLPRIREILNPPDTISIEVENGMVVLRGAASQEWIDEALTQLKGLTGMPSYRTDSLIASDVAEYRRWEQFLQRLEDEPGIVVLKSGRRNNRFYVSGLRDPLGRNPETLMGSAGISSHDVDSHWEAYQALDPELALARAQQVLMPPPTVTFELREGVLYAKGRAPYKWIDRARDMARGVGGVREMNTDQLVDEDWTEVQAVQAQIEAETFRFLMGAPDLWPGQGGRLDALIASLARLERVAGRSGKRVTVEIRGYTESTGQPQKDKADSADLVNSFYEILSSRGLDMSSFIKRGMGSAQPPQADASVREANNRVVSLKILFDTE